MAVELFPISPNDPLADAHAAVAAFLIDTQNPDGGYWQKELKDVPTGAALLAAKPPQARRYVRAAIAQAIHYQHQEQYWRQHSRLVVATFLRRALPFERDDIIALLRWCNGTEGNFSTYYLPLGGVVMALTRDVAANPPDEELTSVMREFAGRLRATHDKQAKRLGTTVEQLLPVAESDEAPPATVLPPLKPAPAGSPAVLTELKQCLGMITETPEVETTELRPDGFPLRTDSPLVIEHDLLTRLFQEIVGQPGYHDPALHTYHSGQQILHMNPDEMGRMFMAAAERHVHARLAREVDYSERAVWQSRHAAHSLPGSFAKNGFSCQREVAFDLLLYLSTLPAHQRHFCERALPCLLPIVEAALQQSPASEGERYVLSLFRASMIQGPPLGLPSAEVAEITKWIGDGAAFVLVPGEVWSDAINADLAAVSGKDRAAWLALFQHAVQASSARPSGKWLKTATALIEKLGADKLQPALARWLPLVAKGQSIRRLPTHTGDTRGGSDTIQTENAICLCGLLWCIPLLPNREALTRIVADVAQSAYKKVPGVGPRAVKVGNQSVYVLSEIGTKDAVGQLAKLKVRVKFGTAQKEIEKALTSVAAALDLPRDQVEELAVPSYGLEEVGLLTETLGNYRAELRVTGSDAELNWFDAAGKPLKSVPAKVKSDHKEELKDLQQSLKDIQAMLPAQRDRIDGLFLQQKSWAIADWRERYHDHPLVGTIAQRLLWFIDGTPALFQRGTPTDAAGQPIEHGTTAEVTLWHPVGRSIDEIIAWRQRLESLGLTQPFKQAHREVYLLTDAERRTNTYSNRYAAHVIRQHQFNALCAARGWKNRLRLAVDDSYLPPYKELPLWGLRAEFWVEGVVHDDRTDINDSGVYLRLTTDQVRFYRTDAAPNYVHASGGGYESAAAGPGTGNTNAPLPLEQVPPLVFSEIMRDVDLFVGVASIGNDPTWQDGGAEGRYREYWHSYSFGELSGTASTRKEVLERLVPRLKIAARCSFSDRFLVVRGDLRTYKIHLGSGNILMEPNDQYLCIVPDAKMRSSQDNVYLPFEGDGTLSVIISKALLLAADTKIKDNSITSQIGRKNS